MANSKSNTRLIVTSVLVSLAVIAIFIVIFANFIMPAFQISNESLHSILTAIFPILAGLLLLQIGVFVGDRHLDEEAEDKADKLPPNAYTKPFETVNDDPAKETVEVVKEVVKEVPVEVIKEVIKEVPVEVIKEVPVEVVKEVSVAGTEGDVVQLNFEQALESEIAQAAKSKYDVTLALVKGASDEEIENAFSSHALIFDRDADKALIFPLANEEEVTAIFDSTKLEISKALATSPNGSASAETLLKQVSASI